MDHTSVVSYVLIVETLYPLYLICSDLSSGCGVRLVEMDFSLLEIKQKRMFGNGRGDVARVPITPSFQVLTTQRRILFSSLINVV